LLRTEAGGTLETEGTTYGCGQVVQKESESGYTPTATGDGELELQKQIYQMLSHVQIRSMNRYHLPFREQ